MAIRLLAYAPPATPHVKHVKACLNPHASSLITQGRHVTPLGPAAEACHKVYSACQGQTFD